MRTILTSTLSSTPTVRPTISITGKEEGDSTVCQAGIDPRVDAGQQEEASYIYSAAAATQHPTPSYPFLTQVNADET